MTDTAATGFQRFQPWRRPLEIGFWVLVLLLQAGFNSVVSWVDLRRGQPDHPFWPPLVWELSSVLVIGLLVPAVVAWERRHPVRLSTLPGVLGWHLAATLVFTAVHLAGIVGLRQLAYGVMGMQYRVGDWVRMFGYEYLKDVRTYALILVAVLSWRLLLLRWQGEARVLDEPEPGASTGPGRPPVAPEVPQRPERFLVRKLRKEFLIAAADIDWFQAQGNYVGLRVKGHDYLVRSTLTDFLGQLDPARFVRVHRGHAVNLDSVAEIEPLDGGDARLTLQDGSRVPCSRRYRDALAAPAAGARAPSSG